MLLLKWLHVIVRFEIDDKVQRQLLPKEKKAAGLAEQRARR